MFKRLGLGGLAIASLFEAFPRFEADIRRGSGEKKRAVTSSFDPHINRHTGRPHEHKREIARRLRQVA